MSIIDKYNTALYSKRKELNEYVSNSIARITLPVAAPSPNTQQKQSEDKKPRAFILGGGVVLIAGIALSRDVLTVLGGLAALGGGIVMQASASKKSKAPIAAADEPKYYQLTNRIYEQLADIQKHLLNEWEAIAEYNKGKLKNEISSLGLDETKKNEAIQSILSTSVIDISMMTVSSELSAIERQKSVDAYRQYLQTFKSRCIQALDKAVSEQAEIYSTLNDIL